jgi:hypothetical protein
MTYQHSRHNSTSNAHRKLLVSVSNQHDNFYDHDKISVSSMSAFAEDTAKLNKDQQSNGEPQPQMHRAYSLFMRNWNQTSEVPLIIGANITDDNHGLCGEILFFLSWFLIVLFFPMSLFATIKVVQEYE